MPVGVPLAALAVSLCVLGGCVGSARPAGTSAPPVVIARTAEAGPAARQIAELARDADVVYLGEMHDNPHHHAHQAQIVEALVAAGLRPALAFEMLPADSQAAVDAALADVATRGELDQRLRWTARGWPDFAMYAPLFELAARERLPVIALDLDAASSRRVSREGLAALGPQAASLGSLLPADGAREAAIAAAIRDGHCGLLPEARLPNMVEAWHARNVTMARALAAALGRASRPVVVIAGRGHQAAGGLPDQLAAIRPGLRQLVVAMTEVDARGPAAEPVAADVIWLTPAVDRGDPCELLRRPPR